MKVCLRERHLICALVDAVREGQEGKGSRLSQRGNAKGHLRMNVARTSIRWSGSRCQATGDAGAKLEVRRLHFV